METGILLIFRIVLLALLWLFVLSIVRLLRKDLTTAAGPAVVQNSLPKLGTKGSVSRLTVIDGPLTGSHMDISSLSEITIGRSQDAEFVVGDDFASGRHARVFKRGNDWYVEDLASRNGTFLSGMRIEQPEKVELGSDIKIGRTTLRLEP